MIRWKKEWGVMMKLSEKQIEDINEIAGFLAIQDEVPEKVDLCILLGSAMVKHLKTVARMYREQCFFCLG